MTEIFESMPVGRIMDTAMEREKIGHIENSCSGADVYLPSTLRAKHHLSLSSRSCPNCGLQ